MNENLDKIIKLLEQVETSDIELLTGEADGKIYIDTKEPGDIIDQIIDLANIELITVHGGPCYSKQIILHKAGFSVFAGETDSFGWLSGCISTKKGIIVYG